MKPSPIQTVVLERMAARPGVQLYGHGTDRFGVIGIGLTGCSTSLPGGHRRITRRTLQAMLDRGWVVMVRETRNGETSGTRPDGTWGVVDQSWGRYYDITDTGRAVAKIGDGGCEAMIDHPRCELCQGYPTDGHCWTHTYEEEEGDPPEGRYRCRHCSAVGHECEECGGTGIRHSADEADVDREDDCPACDAYGVIDDTIGEPVIHRRRRAR